MVSVTCVNVGAKSIRSLFRRRDTESRSKHPSSPGKEGGRKGVYNIHPVIRLHHGLTFTLAHSVGVVRLRKGMRSVLRCALQWLKKKACCPFKLILHAKISNEPPIPYHNPTMFDKTHMVGYWQSTLRHADTWQFLFQKKKTCTQISKVRRQSFTARA